MVISGLVYSINLNSRKAQLLSSDLRLDQYQARINWSYADDKIILFDYPARPLIIDGDSIRRASDLEVPITVGGSYNGNRLFVYNNEISFTAGDPVGSLLLPNAPITFEEIYTASSPYVNQIFNLPNEDTKYPITAMGFLQMIDSSTGLGSLFVATEKKFYTYPASQPRAQWTQGVFGSLALNVGIAGQRAFVNVNSDLIFLSGEGNIHAFSTARNDAQKWGNVPASREVSNYLRYNDKSLRQFAVLGYHDNRIYISANPYRVLSQNLNKQPVSDYAHGGFVVLEIENLASFLSSGTPTWSGLWTGVNPLDVAEIGEDFYVMSKDGGGNALYILEKELTYDTVLKRKRLVRSIIYTKSYDFKNRFQQKKESSLLFHIKSIGGCFTIKIERKPSHSHVWELYDTWRYNAPLETCDIPEDSLINGIEAHQLKELIFGDPLQSGHNPINQDEYNTFKKVQYRITIEGESWILDDFKITAVPVPFEERQDTFMQKTLDPVMLPKQCAPDWLIPEENVCL